MASSFGLNPLDAAIGDADTAYSLSPGSVNPTARVAAPGLGQPDPTEQRVNALNANEPGTYAALAPVEYEAFQKKQQESSPGYTRPFSAGVEAGFISNGTMGGNFLQALGVKFNNTTLYDAGKSLQDASANSSKGLEPRVGSVADVSSAKDAWDYVKYQTGNSIGSSAPSLVTGVLASLVTENPVLGLAAGAAAPSYIQNTGDMYGMLRDSPGIAEQVKAGKLTPGQIVDYSMLAGVPLAALDIMGEVETLGLSKVLGGAIDKATVGQLKKSIIGRLTKAMAQGAIAEGGTEALQQVIEEGVAEALGDKAPLAKRVISVLDNAIGGFLGGGAMGGGAHALNGALGRGAPVDSEQATPAPQPASAAAWDAATPAVPAAQAAVPGDPAAPVAAQMAAPAPAPAAGPLGRAMERGNAANTATAAEAMVPVGTPVAISMAGGPPMNVTVQGYHADGMDVVDASGEVHTLPMNDPEVSVTPLGGATPVTVAEPHPEPKTADDSTGLVAMGSGMADGITGGMYDMLWGKVESGDVKENGQTSPLLQAAMKVRDAGGMRSRDEFVALAKDFGANVESGAPTFQTDMRALVQRHIPAASETKPTEQRATSEKVKEDREVKPIPFSLDVGKKKVAFPSDALAALYDVGQRRNSFRQGGRDTGATDSLIEPERKRVADLLGIPLSDVNAASDEYRHMVEQATKGAKDSALAPEFEPKTLTAARDAWSVMAPADRKALLNRVGVKRSPKMEWAALGTSIQNKIKPAMAGPTLDEAAHDAATSPANDLAEPSQAQKEAGNYKLGHYTINGLDLSIENPEGSERKGVDPNGKPWSTTMQSHYGYIKGTVGYDKDHVDVFVKSNTPKDWSGTVYVVDQNKANGHFDEHKAMIGFDNEAEARAAYNANYSKDWKGLGTVTQMPLQQFKNWLDNGAPKEGRAANENSRHPDGTHRLYDDNDPTLTPNERAAAQYLLNKEPNGPHAASLTAMLDRGHTIEGERAGVGEEDRALDHALRAHDAAKQEEQQKPKAGSFPAVQKDAKWFGTHERAEKYAEKQGMGSSHEIVQTQKSRFEIRPKVEQIAENAKKPADAAAKAAPKGVEPVMVAAPVKEPSPARKPARKTKGPSPLDRLENYFRPGRIVKSYDGQDEVLGFRREDGDHWSVKVRETKPDGSPDPSARVRSHETAPSERELAAWEMEHPVEARAAPAASPAEKPAYGASNKLVTADRAEEVRAKLRAKLRGQINSGIDPEILALGAELAAFHIEAGSRKFADVVRAVAKDLGTNVSTIRKYVRAWYNGARDMLEDSGHDIAGMDTPETVRAQVAALSDQESENGSGLEGGDREGIRQPESERRGAAQQGTAPDNSGELEAAQPEDVGEPASGRDDGQAGLRPAREDVGADERADEGRNAVHGRAGTGRAGNPDARAGGGRAGSVASVDAARAEKRPDSVSPADTGPGDFHIDDPRRIVGGGPVARFEKNKSAIELRNRLLDLGVKPTREQQDVLAGYTGWGSFGQELFQGSWDHPKPKEGWEARDKWLRENLGKDEWDGLQRSIINAHFTDPPTVNAMWDMVRRAGFNGGRVLEPAIGIGNFFGLMPPELTSRSTRAGIELDPVTGSMAQMLYPAANIQIKGFEESKTPDNFYDLVIGNWPFANIKPADRRYNRLGPSLHDYFFLKALDQTRPGGLVVGITSASTMDKKDSAVRAEMARKGELVAAFRLPSGAFEEYAGTNVVTDILLLRKRPEPAGIVANEGWIKSVDMDTKAGEKVSINEYYHAHPENVIGQIDFGHGTTTFRPGMIVHRPDNMAERLAQIVNMVPEGAYHADTRGEQISYVANSIGDRTGALVKTDDGFHIVQGEHLALANDVQKYEVKNDAENKRREAQLSGLIDMRKLYGSLLDAQRAGDAETQRKALNNAYKAFTREHGPLSESFGLSYLQKIKDPFYASLASLESRVETKDGDTFKPAAVLTENTMRGAKRIENPSVSEAFVLARNEAVDPSPARIAEIAGKPEAEVRRELIDKGAAVEGPSGEFVPTDIYLSGNVREKLRQAQAAYEQGNKTMQRNIEALQKVMPADVPYFKIETQMGATWVTPKLYGEYVAHMLGLPNAGKIDVKFQNGAWKVDFPSEFNNRPEAQSGFGMASSRGRFKRLVRAALANQTITIKETDSDGKEYVNHELTKEANEKVANMRMRFGEWMWRDPTRRVEMEREYNEVRNAYANPSYDGSFLSFPGMALSIGNGPFDLRQHQVNAIWRALVTRKSLNAHEVGTGKTFTAGGIAVESRRYGIAKKPMIFAHNANSKSVAAEIQMMYPAAKLLYVDNLSPDNIKTRMMQIANDDWDAIVIPHSLIDQIGFKEETMRAMAQEELDALEREAREAAEEDGAKITDEMWEDEEALKKLRAPTAKDLVKQRLRIINQIKKLAQRASREDSIAFEDLGVDMLLVDETHEFKKPPIATKMRMKGLQTQTSDRSIALMFLTKYIRGMNNGANVHLFTGTPITNTLTEVFHQMRYIMNEEMAQTGLSDWDGWFGSFAREVNDVELSSTGEYEPVTRLQAFINVPELRRMIGQYMDVVFSDDMPEMKPREVNGKTISDPSLTDAERAELLNGRTENAADRPYKKVGNSSADMSPEQASVFQHVQALAKKWRQMNGKERREAMRRGDPVVPIIYDNIAEKASFDVRLVNAIENAGQEGKPELEPHPESKPARAVRNLVEIYRSHPQANQVVFMEQGMHRTVTRSEGEPGDKVKRNYKAFSTMYDMIERLVQAGVPREEIAVVSGATSKDKRKSIADGMNTGRFRIVFGSTGSLGVGVNMQRNLRAMHHLDAPWMPGDLEQRNGRGQRQGNQWNTVLEHRYLTDKLDGRRWQVLAIKQKFISEFLKSDDSVRVIEGDAAADEQGDILSTFSEAAGDPRVLVREKLKKRIEQLQSRERTYLHGKEDAKREAVSLRKQMPALEKRLADFRESGVAEQAASLMDAQRGDGFNMTIGRKTYAARKDGAEAVRNIFASGEIAIGEDKQIGVYGGVPLHGIWGRFNSKPDLYVALGGEVARSEGPSLPSLEAAIRELRGQREKKLAGNVAEVQRALSHNETVEQEPFHFADKLDDTKRQLADLEKDITNNPVAPPYWLRAGAPTETEVYAGGKPYAVTGHRWADDGFFVLALDGSGKAIAIPYIDAKDKQGMPLYEQHRFVAPTKTEATPAAAVKAVGDEAPTLEAAESVPAGNRAGMSADEVRQSIDQSELAKPLGALIDAGKVKIESRADTAAEAYTDADGTIHLVAPNLAPEAVQPAVLHEAFHSGVRPLLGDEAWSDLLGRLRSLYNQARRSEGGARAVYDRALARMENAQAASGVFSAALTPEEFGAYVISEHEAMPRALSAWARDAIGAVKAWALRHFGRQIGAVTPEQLRRLAMAAIRDGAVGSAPRTESVASQTIGPRSVGVPADAASISTFRNDAPMKAHADYRAAKAGDNAAAQNLVRDLVKPDQIEAARTTFGKDAIYAPVIALEATGHNAIPWTLAEYFAAQAGGSAATGIYQANQAFHTGAKAMERIANRAVFAGSVERGGRYVLVDDVSVMGSTLAEMANHIATQGGRVVGVVTLVDAGRTGKITPTRQQINEIERRFGDVIRQELKLDPAALTAGEAGYLLNFRDADALRSRVASSRLERGERLGAKGIQQGSGESLTSRRESIPANDQGAERAMPRTVEELSDAVKGLAEDVRGPALSLLPLNVMTDWAAPNQVAVQQYVDTKRRMDTYRNKKQNAADEVVQKWRRAVGKGGKDAAPLAAVMHDATLLGFDPARPSDGWEANPVYAALMARYRALTPAAQSVYEEVRDGYETEADERDKVILENVSKAMDQELRNAERARDRELASIRDEGLTGDEKKKAVDEAEAKFKRAAQKLKFSKKARLAALRAAFESNRVPKPYFPLARFGQYFAAARDNMDKVVSFSRVETKGQLDRLVRDLRKQLPHANIETGLLEDKGGLRSQMDPRVLADIQAILGNAGVSEEVMDQVWQRYLEAMPDLSIRKRAIHRGGVSGFNTDAMRAFASHMFHSAHQMGRMKYGSDLLELVNQAADQAKQAQNPISAMKVANELRNRHDWVMNPKNSSWANAATTLGFLYFLGASPASAAVNLSQTAIMGVPILGSRFGMGKATAALMKASRDFVGGKGSVETSSNLTDLEKVAIADLYERGALDKSMSHDLAGVADRGAGYNPTRQRVMKVMSYMFHHAERFNREVTALASYRLARQAGVAHAAAVEKAGELTWLTHFDYSNTNRPRVMQHDAAKVALLFKNFQINMIYRLFRDTQQAFAGDTPQARKHARYQLAGIMGMYALMAGGLGVPLMKQVVIPLWKLFFGNDDDKSADEEFRGAVLNTLGPQLGGVALDGVPGYLTGTSLTQRIGMADLWFQSDDRVKSAQDWWNSLASDMLGPVWGMAHNVYNGFNVIRDGKGVARGVEMVMPTAARNAMKAWRYSQEGVVNLRGDIVVSEENLGIGDSLKQALGFTPAMVAEQYTRNDEKANMDKRIGQQRKQLLDAFAKAQKSGDESGMSATLADIEKFNAVPTHAAKRITAQTIRESVRTRARLSSRAENGIIIQNKRQNAILNEQMPPRVY